MKTPTYLLIMVLVFAPLFGLSAEEAKPEDTKEENGKFEIEAGLIGTYPSITGNEAKFNEYGDMQDGVVGAYGNIFLRYDNQKGYFMDFSTADIGYETQSYRLDGKKSGDFQYFFFYKEIPHNITWDAISPYSTPGSDNLAYGGGISSNIGTWMPFDYSTLRKNYGGGISVERLKPFYVDFSVSQEKQKGIKPFGAEGAAGFGNVIELPEPIDYTTDQMKAEVGYAKQPFFLSAKYLFSRFSNNNEILLFRNPFLSTQPNVDAMPLAPDNKYQKFALAGNVKLPMRSKFNMNLAYSDAKSDTNLLNSIWQADTLTPVALTSNTFHGEIKKKIYDFILTSNPFSYLEGQIFYKYLSTDNKSDIITIADGTRVLTNEPFDYSKKTYGGELDFRLYKGLHFLAGYKHIDLDRNWVDIPNNQDDIYSASLIYRMKQYGVIRLMYEKLNRTADLVFTDLTVPNRINLYQRRYDSAAKDRDTFKASAQLMPLDELSVDLGYRYARTDYNDTYIGLQKDTVNEFSINADYTFNKYLRLFGYFDIEKREINQFQRSFSTNPDPFGNVQDAGNFNWQSNQHDKTYDYGIGMDIHAIPKKLSFRFSYDNIQANGENDFTYLTATALTGGRNNDNIDISAWDDYRREFFIAKVLYQASPSLTLTAGYAYEQYRSSDAQYNGYKYTVGTNTFLTGAYGDQSYKASIVFMGLSYKFQ